MGFRLSLFLSLFRLSFFFAPLPVSFFDFFCFPTVLPPSCVFSPFRLPPFSVLLYCPRYLFIRVLFLLSLVLLSVVSDFLAVRALPTDLRFEDSAPFFWILLKLCFLSDMSGFSYFSKGLFYLIGLFAVLVLWRFQV